MAKDVTMQKGNDTIIINENNIAHYERLGYKAITKETKEKKDYGNSSWQRGRGKDRK